MTLKELAASLGLDDLTPEIAGAAERDITQGYVSDLLSDVLAHGPQGGVLVTIQVHMNVIAVAVHADLAAVIFAHERTPDDEVLRMAVKEGIALYRSPEGAFDIVGKLYALGLRGTHA